MKRLMLGISGLLISFALLAASPDEVRKQAQASMLVTGSIEVSPDGKVKDYLIDKQDKLPAPVVALIGKSIATWQFQPVLVNGKAVEAKARMNVRVVAKRLDNQHDTINITGAQFGNSSEKQGETISRKKIVQPSYPALSRDAGVSGTVYLLLRVGRNGAVVDAAAEQVNLGVYASEHDMERFRRDLAIAALKAARKWTFNTPTIGKHVDDQYWVARAPIAFTILPWGQMEFHQQYGKWDAYIPGPREVVPWLEKSRLLSGDPDAAPAGGVVQLDQGLQLTTPLAGA